MITLNFTTILLVLIPTFIYFRVKNYIKDKENFNILKEITVILFFIYVLVVGYITLKPFNFVIPFLGGTAFRFDMNLFYNLRNMAGGHQKLLYSAGNILMLVPFGIFAPLLFKRARSLLGILGLGFAFSLTIELTQSMFTFARFGTVDDLFFNTLGAVIGFILFLGLKLFSRHVNFLHKILMQFDFKTK